MNTRVLRNKRISLAANASAIVLSVLSVIPFQPAQAGVVASGTATLADSVGTASGPEALTVDYQVDLSGGIYTYTYTVNNPAGDSLLPPNQGPESVDQFSLDFNAAVSGAVLAGSMGGSNTTTFDNGNFGLEWLFTTPLAAGTSSDILSFESDYAPTLGNATASGGANGPSPWTASPDGTLVALPGKSVPDSTFTMTLFAGALLLLGCGKSRIFGFSS
jgi:hypothetical protein